MTNLTNRLWEIINLKKSNKEVPWGAESAVMVDIAYEIDRLNTELDAANAFINDAFTAHPNLDKDVENVRRYG